RRDVEPEDDERLLDEEDGVGGAAVAAEDRRRRHVAAAQVLLEREVDQGVDVHGVPRVQSWIGQRRWRAARRSRGSGLTTHRLPRRSSIRQSVYLSSQKAGSGRSILFLSRPGPTCASVPAT